VLSQRLCNSAVSQQSWRRGTLTLALSRFGPALPPKPCCCASSTACQVAPPYCDTCLLLPPLPALRAGSGAGLLPAAGSGTKTLVLLLPLALPAAECALPADACCTWKPDSSCSWMHAVLERTATSSALLSALASIRLACNLHNQDSRLPVSALFEAVVQTPCPQRTYLYHLADLKASCQDPTAAMPMLIKQQQGVGHRSPRCSSCLSSTVAP
jgi:hypothetical protein